MKKVLIILVAVAGIIFWNIPATTSLFYGEHTFSNTSNIQCEKCHQDVSTLLLNSPQAHQDLGCKGCHTADRNTSHAAKILSCSDCHVQDTHQIAYNNTCNTCHTTHGGQINKGTTYTSCRDCHTNASDIHHELVLINSTIYGCMDCHPSLYQNTIYIETNCLNCHNGTAFWANPVVNIPVNNHHNYTAANTSSCINCHG